MEISYIITVYNKERYLKEVIQGIHQQKGNFHNEIIFINDGSTDQSLNIIENEIQGIENVRVISQVNQGLIRATIRGINEAKGKYIIFCDGDDVLLPDVTELLVKGVELANVKLATCCLFIPKNKNLTEKFLSQKSPYYNRKFNDYSEVQSSKVNYHYIIEDLPDFKKHEISGYILKDAFDYALHKDAYFIGATGSLIENSLAKKLANIETKALHTQDILFTMSALIEGYSILCVDAIGSFINEQFKQERLSTNIFRVCNDAIGTYLSLIQKYPNEFERSKQHLTDIVLLCLKRSWYRDQSIGIGRCSITYFLYKIKSLIVKCFGIKQQAALKILQSILSEK